MPVQPILRSPLGSAALIGTTSPGRSWQPGLFQVYSFDQLQTLFGMDNQIAQNGCNARLLRKPQGGAQPLDPVSQPDFLFLELHDTHPVVPPVWAMILPPQQIRQLRNVRRDAPRLAA